MGDWGAFDVDKQDDRKWKLGEWWQFTEAKKARQILGGMLLAQQPRYLALRAFYMETFYHKRCL